MVEPAVGDAQQHKMHWLRPRADDPQKQGGKKHQKDFIQRGGNQMNKMTRAVALALVGVMIIALLASVLFPYI